jgi:hypothetical protein
MTTHIGCDKCKKSSLSLLLLRPSPLGLSAGTAPYGADKVKSDPTVVEGLLPTKLPTESRFALRMLRAGYLHVYIEYKESAPAWKVFRVTADSDLLPESDALFAQKDATVTCTNVADHIKAGRKLLTIAQAHTVKGVWIAFSGNLWSDKIKKRNQAKGPAMQEVLLAGGSKNTFAPTAENLKSKVMEFGIEHWAGNSAGIQKFKFTSFKPDEIDELAADLVRAAGCHPKTKGKELAVVLHDPVGIAAELNAIRMLRDGVIQKELAQPEILHPLKSSWALRGIEKSFVDSSQLKSFDKVSPRGMRGMFTKEHEAAGAEWHPIDQAEKDALLAPHKCSSGYPRMKEYLDQSKQGRIIYEDQDARQVAWIKEQTAKMWEKISPHYDETARAKWETAFATRMAKVHYGPLERCELDWRNAVDDPKTLAYFDLHFDPTDPNDSRHSHSPGAVYAEENDHINSPIPFTKGKVLEIYASILDKKISDKAAIALRALVGNQQDVIDVVIQQLVGDPGAEEGGGVRDKTYDILKDIPHIANYSWYANGVMLFGMGQLTALTGAAIALGHTKFVAARMKTLMNHWVMQQAMDHVRSAAVHGSARGIAPKMPVLITMAVSRAAALDILRLRGGAEVGISKTQIKKRTKHNAKIILTLLTDTETLRAAAGNAEAVARSGTTSGARIGRAAADAATDAAALAKVTQLTEAEFLHLYRTEQTRMVTAVSAVRNAMDSSAGKAANAMMGLEGRLAFGCIIVQIIGLINAINTVRHETAAEKADAQKLRDGWFGVFDSGAGLLGGLLQMAEYGTHAYHANRVGAAIADASKRLGAIKFSANIMGMAGGIINAFSMWIKSGEADEKGDALPAKLYLSSFFMFTGTVFTSGALSAGVLAETAVARGATSAVVRTIAVRAGSTMASAALVTIGGTALTVSGVGLVLLGVGIVVQIGAVALTPSDVQRWVGRSYFGVDKEILGIWGGGKRKDRFKSWDAELAELNAIMLAPVPPPPAKTEEKKATNLPACMK